MAFEIEVVSVLKKDAVNSEGDSYSYTELNYKFGNDPRTMKVFPGTIKKYPELEGPLKNLKPKQKVQINLKDNGKGFKELSEIISGSSKPATKSSDDYSKTKKHSDDYSIGQQVGNAITNACSTVKAGATIKQIEERVWELVLLGERIKSKIKSGEHLKDNKVPNRDISLEEQDPDLHPEDPVF